MSNPTMPNTDPPPELLAPAGNWDCVAAAIENGADAVYFGLDTGFNARHRAANFGLGEMDELMATLRRRGVRGYVTLNTLVFPSEMLPLARVVEAVASAGVDAVLVQDFGVARLVEAICPEMERHASTQMSLTSAETIDVAAQLGLSRVVLARELSIREIRKIRRQTDIPLEAFIHGALCVAYSGQCLTSESLGGRSANRGQCAQACRLPYELVCDGEDRDLGDVKYLLSPQDLAGYAAIPDMIDAGVNSLKIEGRLKTPEYVANITGHYRRAIDQAMALGTVTVDETDRHEMELSFSRGFTPGWLEGNDHKRLVPGLRSAKQGVQLGNVLEHDGDAFRIRPSSTIRLGDGIAISSRCNNDLSLASMASGHADHHQGGRVYSIHPAGHRRSHTKWKEAAAGQDVWIGLKRGDIDFHRVDANAVVFKTDDPQLQRRLAQSFRGKPGRSLTLDFRVIAAEGSRLRIEASTESIHGRRTTEIQGDEPLERAKKHPVTPGMLADKLGRLGDTVFRFGNLESEIHGSPMVPMAMVNGLRRRLVQELDAQVSARPSRSIDARAGAHWSQPIESSDPSSDGGPLLGVLCRTRQQLDAAIDVGVDRVIADFHDVRDHRQAVDAARAAGVPIELASLRIQKPAEMGLVRQMIRLRPDGILARNLASLQAAIEDEIPVVADFSLNASNHRSAEWLHDLGADRMTASYDLNADQLDDLIGALPAHWLEIVVHQHMPMFHMEHCVFCSVLSAGMNKTNCGRPCDRHVVQLRDRVGKLHVLQADIGCRNTLFNADAQSAAEVVGRLMTRGCRYFRVELLQESATETRRVVSLYRQLLQGDISGSEVWKRLSADNRVGVTRGTMEAKRDPLAIL